MSDGADCSAIEASAAALRQGLRELTANLLRVARGTGRPELIVSQSAAVVELASAYRAAAGTDPSAVDIGQALRFEHIPDDDNEAWPDWDRAVRDMVSGALQVAAAELLGQRPQAAEGRRELFAGYRHVEKLHSKQLRRLLARRTSDNEN